MLIQDLGLVDFAAALSLQDRLVAGIAAQREEETLLLLEHPPVYTIGSGGNPDNILDPALHVQRINRGGDVTFHGPGQLVGYPLLNLSRFDRDLHRYLRFLEALLIATANSLGVVAGPRDGRTGVWTKRGKLASIGVGVRKWVSMHGFALNCAVERGGFAAINPCGMPGCPMTSLEAESGAPVSRQRVKQLLGAHFWELLPGAW